MGGDFTGELVNGTNNHKPYLAAYPDPNAATDTQPPTGAFDTAQAIAWAKAHQGEAGPDGDPRQRDPRQLIARTVDWGDGTSADWATGTTLSHVYKSAWHLHARVTMTDQAGNSRTGRLLGRRGQGRLGRPQGRRAPAAAAQALGQGVAEAARQGHRRRHRRQEGLAEGRSRSGRGTGTRTTPGPTAGSRPRPRPRRSRAAGVDRGRRTRQHRWTGKLRGLRKGTLVYKVWATDAVKNRSATVTHKASLSRR